jgi:hypothetical protein
LDVTLAAQNNDGGKGLLCLSAQKVSWDKVVGGDNKKRKKRWMGVEMGMANAGGRSGVERSQNRTCPFSLDCRFCWATAGDVLERRSEEKRAGLAGRAI